MQMVHVQPQQDQRALAGAAAVVHAAAIDYRYFLMLYNTTESPMKRNFITLLFLFIAMSFSGCAQTENSISMKELKEKLKSDKKDFIVLDVRSPQELKGELGKIDIAINIPLPELTRRMDELTPYKEKQIYVVCRSGNRSGVATEDLLKAGYKAKNVSGGMLKY